LARLYSDENFPVETVEALRRLGHDVVTALDAGQANQAVPDKAVLTYAASLGRTLLTLNRWDFVRLHTEQPGHAGVVVCSPDADPEAQAAHIDSALRSHVSVEGVLLRVNRAPR
jgi:hypothetical protein